MREIIAICRSNKKSRERTARVLDQYFWRIGNRTWRGKATNACLDRVARELRHQATRNTAVTIHEIRSAHESRIPLIRIGSKAAFSKEGLAPVASHPSVMWRRSSGSPSEASAFAAVRIAALFHDLGKATILFQEKLRRAMNGGAPEPDAVRHELHSAVVWDLLVAETPDESLQARLLSISPQDIDHACGCAIEKLAGFHERPATLLDLDFLKREGSLDHLIGMLVLTHHRLPEGDTDHLAILPTRHVNADIPLDRTKLAVAAGVPFWHEEWWLFRLRRSAALLEQNAHVWSADIALRASLMFADHLGSSEKQISNAPPDHLANTMSDKSGRSKPLAADSLSQHVRRVYTRTRGAFDLLHRYRDRFPALDEGQVPADIMYPTPSADPRFRWQADAARAARVMCEAHEGGFFACILSGTGSGKTRGAPTILANAAMGDTLPERRYLRFSLALGLRVLATQSAKEYVGDLGFRDEDVSVLVGHPPLNFNALPPNDSDGSESRIDLPEWLRVERVAGGLPAVGDNREGDWIRSLSVDTDRSLPAFCDLILDAAGKRGSAGRRIIAPPLMIGTIDHLMGVASPVNSRFLLQSIRLVTSDLILDEIDQFDGEDIAAIGRLIFQAGASGRRVIIMSATLTPDIAGALYSAYCYGWKDFARARGISEHVNLLCTGDAPASSFTNENGQDLDQIFADCCRAILRGLREAPAFRRGELLAPCEAWGDLIAQIDTGCSKLHALNATSIDGFTVSVGLVRMTRISHTTALAVQLPSGAVRGHFRVTLCLHSQFPRLQRQWIEKRLKQALTRKMPMPNMGLRELCIEQNLFARAEASGTHKIEIVVITSAVIETGNDLDFDYAILDPVSMRSIIQTAGRVCRHRPPTGEHTNILILGRSPIAMQEGVLAMPGVETKPSSETGVVRRSLEAFEGRFFRDLAGDIRFDRISAEAVMSSEGQSPLRDEEGALRKDMVDPSMGAPLGKYLRHINARMNLTMTRTRKFRRSETHEILYRMEGDNLADARWYVDLAPGKPESILRLATENGLEIDQIKGEHLFKHLTELSWHDYSNGVSQAGRQELALLMQVSVSDHRDDFAPALVCTEFTGFTRGTRKDLFCEFGKNSKDQ